MSGDGTETVPLPEPVAWAIAERDAEGLWDDLCWTREEVEDGIRGLPEEEYLEPAALVRLSQVEQYGRECAKAALLAAADELDRQSEAEGGFYAGDATERLRAIAEDIR